MSNESMTIKIQSNSHTFWNRYISISSSLNVCQ